ncbi:MAG: tetratricopeptide repeat protein [Phycisphaerae bacterium]|nr:tetratricopeptide repeat protein [Phycisphaerae bacterium]
MTIREKALGPDRPDVGVSLNNLAGLYHTQGKYDQAEALFKRAVAIYETRPVIGACDSRFACCPVVLARKRGIRLRVLALLVALLDEGDDTF